MIIGLCGVMGSGKDTVADYLVNFHGWRRESFANSLKDGVANIFGWDRQMLEGRTKQSREWREQVDPWWATRLGMKDLTPRWVLQYFGTEVVRSGFHDDMWIASLENKLRNSKDNVVITDVRFRNEIRTLRGLDAQIVEVARGDKPKYWNEALKYWEGGPEPQDIHRSEWDWIGTEFDVILDNNKTIEDLYEQVNRLLPNQDHQSEPQSPVSEAVPNS